MVLLALGALLLTGCSAYVSQDQTAVVPDAAVVLEPGHPVGQTFVARHGGLNGVGFWLEPQPGGAGVLRLHLRADPQSPADLAVAELPVEAITAPGFYHFSFPPDNRSHSVYRYAFLELEGTGAVRVGAASGEAYIDGAAYRGHEPLDAQLAFRLAYDPWGMALEAGRAALEGVGLLAVAALLYLVPGYAVLAYLSPSPQPPSPSLAGERKGAGSRGGVPWPARMGLAAGLSLALYPLLFLWTDLVGLRLGPLYAWGPVVLGLTALAWRYRRWRPRQGWETLQAWARSDALWPDLAFIIVLALVFGVRLLVVRSLDAPMWGDSYQHAVIAQLLVDNGGLFDSWEPYAELRTFTYHFGFHSAVAVFHWLTGVPVYRATLWAGQILNGLAVLALYPLAIWIGGNRWTGTVAVLVAGLLLPMPMFYVNWGRYTQLAGQVILPAAVVLSGAFLGSPRRKWALAGATWIAIGGLALTHYRVLIFYVLFVIAWLLLSVRRHHWRLLVARVCGAGVGAALLFLPWFLETFVGRITRNFIRQLTTAPDRLSSFAYQYNAIGDITLYMPMVLWLVFVVAVGVALWRRRWGGLLISLWWLIIFIAANPEKLSLPGTGAINNFALFIAVYIPAGLLIGDMVGDWIARWGGRGAVPLAAAVGVLAVIGVPARMKDVQVARHALVTRPDLRAMAWIRENTPQDARFLVNSFFAYGGSVIVGSDGGWWLPLLAGRANTVPPLNYGTEQGPRPDYREWVNELTSQVQAARVDDPATLALLRERGVTHVYIGQQQGRVNYNGPDVLRPEVFFQDKHYRLLYHQDRVWIFEIVGQDSQ